jgi:flagellin-like hook-associated protein FlgL
MASNITLSAGVRQNLLALQNTATLLASTQNRLATGKKVNSALDNPTNFFTSSALSARASDLSSILDQMSNGISTLQAANNGLTAITNTVNSMQATINQARQDSSWKSASYTVDSTAIGTVSAKNLTFSGGAVTGSVNVGLNTASTNGVATTTSTTGAYSAPAAAGQATFTSQSNYAAPGGPTALTITFGAASVVANIGTTTTTIQEAIDAINGAILLDADSNGVFEAYNNGGKLAVRTIANVDGSFNVSGGSATDLGGTAVSVAGSNGQTNFTVNGTAITLTTAEANVTAAVNATNLQLQAASSAFEAFDDTGKLGIREIVGQGAALTIGGADSALFAAVTVGSAGTNGSVKTVDQLVTDINANGSLTGKVKASNDGGKLNIQNLSTGDLTLVGSTSTTVNGGTGGGNTTTVGGNSVRKNLITQFNDLRSQLDKLADDASFNGVNLLRGDTLKLVFNETNTSSISIVSQNANGINTSVLGVAIATGAEFSDNSLLDTRSDALSSALTQLRSQSSAFGSNLSIVQNRQDFTKAMITTLQTGSDNLVLADTNEEAANLLALQTRQQLSTTALSLANQSEQAVLRLF